MFKRMKSWGAATWAAIAAVAVAVIGFIVKLVFDRQDKSSADAVTDAVAVKDKEEFGDAVAAGQVVAAAQAEQAAAVTEVTDAVAAGPAGSDARLEAIDNAVSDMSRKRHEEALRRAGKL